MTENWFDTPWDWIGWIGVSCFFVRFLIQWLASERAGETVTPQAFWWMSTAGAGLMIGYSAHRGEPVFLAGYVVTLGIYLRNLWIHHRPGASLAPLPVTVIAIGAWGLLVWLGLVDLRPGYDDSILWLAIGAVGQALWSSRFVVQWMLSERAGRSHLPEAFWWISLTGNGLLLSYAIFLGDPVWVAGLALGPVVQVRNLVILRRASA